MGPLSTAALLVAALNWKSLPTVHHLRLLLYISKLRLATRNLTEFGQPESVGQHPLRVVSVTHHLCQVDELDVFGFHKNNTTYAVDFDLARLQQVINVLSILFATGGYGISGAKAYAFLREIKPFSRYTCEVRIAAFDDRWIYFVVHWVSLGPKGERRLHAIGLERTFLFMGQGQKRINIARVLALCGLGERLGKRNWERAKALQREGKATPWLREEVEADIDVSELKEIQASEENRRQVAECEGILGGKTWKAFSDRPAAKL